MSDATQKIFSQLSEINPYEALPVRHMIKFGWCQQYEGFSLDFFPKIPPLEIPGFWIFPKIHRKGLTKKKFPGRIQDLPFSKKETCSILVSYFYKKHIMKKVADGKKFTYRNYKVLIISLDKKYASLTYILQLQSKHRFLLILWNRLTKAEF